MSAAYDIQTGDGGTFIVRKYGSDWVRIARFISGEYTAEDESLLGNADRLADALAKASYALRDAATAFRLFGKPLAAEAMEIADKHSCEVLRASGWSAGDAA